MSEQRDARGPNPLRRTSDRIEAWSFFLTVMTMLLVAPWAAWSMAGHTFRADEQATEWERQHRFQVAAVLLEDAATPAEVAAGAGAPSARARWTGPDGVVRTATIPTQPGQRAGHTEPIWVNEQGATVAAPPRRNPMARAILSGLLTAGGGQRLEARAVGDFGGQAQLNRIIIHHENTRHANSGLFAPASNRVPFWEKHARGVLRGD